MKKITIVSVIVILIFNLIVNSNVYADYPSVIDNSIEKENLTQMENAISPNITNDLADEGKVDIHKGSSNNDGTYSIKNESTVVKGTTASSGSTAEILAGIINLFPTTISAIMSLVVLNAQPSDSTIKEFTIQDLVYNQFRLFDINFFEIESSSSDANNTLKRAIARWYTAIRTLAVVISLCVLLYIGIRMALSTSASSKAEYKRMLIDWVVGFVLMFLMQYILVIAIYTSQGLVEILPEQTENLETAMINGNGTEKGLKGDMETSKGWGYATLCVLYWMIVYYQVKFIILYIKRFFSVGLLTVISPLICAVYPIDKVKDKKAQSYKVWLKETLVNIFIQPLHAIMYIIFIGSAAEIAKNAPLLAIIFLGALSRGEKIVKNIFNMRGLTSINSLGTIKIRGGGK